MKRPADYLVAMLCTFFLFACTHKQSTEIPEEKEEMDDVELAIQQEVRMTRDPNTNTVPVERLIEARNYMKSMQARVDRVAALTWQERGPSNVGGRTRAIMIDSRDATGNTVFAASVSGGLFKSTNFTSASASWSPVNDFISNLAITCLLQDRNNGNIMYAGTGEGWFNIDAVRGGGIFKSTDGGVTWNVLPSTVAINNTTTPPTILTFEYVQDLAQDNNGNLYASIRNILGVSRGVQRSTDGGNSWTQVLGAPLVGFATGRASDLEVASNGDLYACLGIFGRSMVWKSAATNGANTGAFGAWQDITPVRTTVTQRVELAIAPSNPQKLYLLMQDSANDTQVGAIYRSSNGGAVWDSLGAPGDLNNGTNSQSWYNLVAAVDPVNENILVVGGFNLARSTDGGTTWGATSYGVGTYHVDQHVLVFNGSSKLIVGNDGGIYYTENANNSSPSFVNKNNGFNCTQYYGVDLHPTDANYFLAGAQDNGTQKFIAAGINATTNASGGDGGWPHISQTNPNLQITANTGNRYNISTNGGGSFSFANGAFNTRGQFINPTDLDDQSNVLYCGDDEGKYFFIRNLTTTPVGTQVTVSGFGTREITFVKVDPVATNTIWLGLTHVLDPAQPNRPVLTPMVMKLSNANTVLPSIVSFGTIGTTLTTDSNFTAGAALSSLDVDPSNGNHVIATLSNYGVRSVWESTDGGMTFNPIERKINLPDMPVWWCMFAPAGAQLNGATGGNGGIILGTDLGVWTTSQINGLNTQWVTNNSGLANVRTYMLRYRSGDKTLVAATHGRGLFTTTLTVVNVTGVPSVPNTKDFIKYVSAENKQLQVVVGNLNTQSITMQLYDMKGRLLMQRRQAYQNTLLDLQSYSTGSYILKIWGNKNERFVKQFINQ